MEKEVMEDVIETRKIPQVKVAHAYTGQGMKVERGEVITKKLKTQIYISELHSCVV